MLTKCATSPAWLPNAACLRTSEWALLLPQLEGSENAPLLFVKPEDRWEVNNVLQHHLDRADELEKQLRVSDGAARDLSFRETMNHARLHSGAAAAKLGEFRNQRRPAVRSPHMTKPWRHIDVETRATCLPRLRQPFEEKQIDNLANELVAAGSEDSCRKVALSLGPKPRIVFTASFSAS